MLQHGSRKVASSINRQGAVSNMSLDPAKFRHFIESNLNFDTNMRLCSLCGVPSEERAPNGTFIQRTDCGNHSIFEHPDMAFRPLSSFMKEATEEHNETNAWCEFNMEKGCADAVYNQDYMMFAKSIELLSMPLLGYAQASFDQHYCYYNGWLEPEIKALQHDYHGMTAKGKEQCNSDHLVKLGSKGNMTLMDMWLHYYPHFPSMPGSRPSIADAQFIAAWTCAMGNSACDMAYCAYSFCVKEDGSLGAYSECPGWDPVKGMPVHP